MGNRKPEESKSWASSEGTQRSAESVTEPLEKFRKFRYFRKEGEESKQGKKHKDWLKVCVKRVRFRL